MMRRSVPRLESFGSDGENPDREHLHVQFYHNVLVSSRGNERQIRGLEKRVEAAQGRIRHGKAAVVRVEK